MDNNRTDQLPVTRRHTALKSLSRNLLFLLVQLVLRPPSLRLRLRLVLSASASVGLWAPLEAAARAGVKQRRRQRRWRDCRPLAAHISHQAPQKTELIKSTFPSSSLKPLLGGLMALEENEQGLERRASRYSSTGSSEDTAVCVGHF